MNLWPHTTNRKKKKDNASTEQEFSKLPVTLFPNLQTINASWGVNLLHLLQFQPKLFYSVSFISLDLYSTQSLNFDKKLTKTQNITHTLYTHTQRKTTCVRTLFVFCFVTQKAISPVWHLFDKHPTHTQSKKKRVFLRFDGVLTLWLHTHTVKKKFKNKKK